MDNKSNYKRAFLETFEMLKAEKKKNKLLQAEIQRERNLKKSQWEFYKKKLIELDANLRQIEINMEKEIEKQLPDKCIDDLVFIEKVENSDAIVRART